MKVTIQNFLQGEPEALGACMERIRRFYGNNPVLDGLQAEVTCFPRQSNGWLEYAIKVPYTTGSWMFIACIQREPGAEFEFHS